VEFDLERLEGMYDSNNKLGIYNTTCIANVKIGFGGACDNFLRRGAFDCTESQEMVTSGDGFVSFSMSSAFRWANLAFSLVTAGVSVLFWI
jgi:hypothetical protein